MMLVKRIKASGEIEMLDLDPTLGQFRHAIGDGCQLIEMVYLPGGDVMIVDEEGPYVRPDRRCSMPINMDASLIAGITIYGTALITGPLDRGGEFTDYVPPDEYEYSDIEEDSDVG